VISDDSWTTVVNLNTKKYEEIAVCLHDLLADLKQNYSYFDYPLEFRQILLLLTELEEQFGNFY
jgi:hypothetical protein